MEIPFIFDPGQVTPAFTKEMLEQIIPTAQILIGNQFEIEMIQKKMGIDFAQLLQLNSNIIITKGEEGSILYTNTEEHPILCAVPQKISDPTGAGDGYRAGLLFGLMREASLLEACKIGSVVGSFVVETIGPQTQVYQLADVAKRFASTFQENWIWEK